VGALHRRQSVHHRPCPSATLNAGLTNPPRFGQSSLFADEFIVADRALLVNLERDLAERALAFTIDNCPLTLLDHIAGPGADDEGQWRINAVNLHPRLPRLG